MLLERPTDPHRRTAFVERVAAQTMSHRRGCHFPEMLDADRRLTFERSERPRRTDDGELAAQAVRAEPHAQLRSLPQDGLWDLDVVQCCFRRCDVAAQTVRFVPPRLDEGGPIALESIT